MSHVFSIPVPDWGSGASLAVSSGFDASGVVQPGTFGLGASLAGAKLLVWPKSRGFITFNVTLKVTHSLTLFREVLIPISQTLDFACDEDGDLSVTMRAKSFSMRKDNFKIGIVLQTWTDHQLGGLGKVKAPPEIRVLHMTMAVGIRVLEASEMVRGHGMHATVENTQTVEHSDLTGKPVAPAFGATGSIDPRQALIDGFAVQLVQPVSRLKGLSKRVLFAKDSAVIDAKEGSDLDRFLRDDVLNLYEVRVPMQAAVLKVEGECRADGTFDGPPDQRLEYNMKLSEDRKRAVRDWMSHKGVDVPDFTYAVGDRDAVPGKVDPQQRSCELRITRSALIDAVTTLWLHDSYLGH